MAQRISMAACLIIMLATLSLSGLVWHQSNQAMNVARRLAEGQAASQVKTIELLTLSHTTDAEILEQLRAMAKAAQSTQAPDWIPVTFKLVLESNDGSPAVAYQASLEKDSEKPPMGFNPRAIRRVSDSGGRVDFGVVQPGDWSFEVSTSWDEEHTWTCRGTINVKLGTKVERDDRLSPAGAASRSVRGQSSRSMAGGSRRQEPTDGNDVRPGADDVSTASGVEGLELVRS